MHPPEEFWDVLDHIAVHTQQMTYLPDDVTVYQLNEHHAAQAAMIECIVCRSHIKTPGMVWHGYKIRCGCCGQQIWFEVA